jgi:acetoin utilization protein AcuB
MFVEQIMSSPVTTIESRARMAEAWALLQKERFRHLPVVEDGALVGIVSDRDVQVERARGWCKRTSPEIESIMRPGVVTARPEMPVEEASRLMLEHKVGALPVLDGERLVGIVSQSDLFRMVLRVLGVMEPSSRLQLELTAPTRQLAEVTRIASEHELPIVSLVTEPADGRSARTVVLRVGTIAPGGFIRDLERAGIRVREPPAV